MGFHDEIVALSISVADDRNGLLLVESMVQRVGWKYGKAPPALREHGIP